MKSVRIEAPARLHWGMFDISGTLGRRFGGLGVAISRPKVVLTASAANSLSASGPEADRVLEFARTYLANSGIRAGAELCVEQAIPGHVGLGSGTKLALAVAQALAVLFDQPTDTTTLTVAVGRGKRSGVGMWSFAQGGLIVEGGERVDRSAPSPLLMRYPMPPDWRCVIATPPQQPGLSGDAEADAFAQIDPTAELAAKISHVTLMSLLPALVEADLAEFGAALTRVQQLVGECFSPVQGGNFANPQSAALVEDWLSRGAAGAGQSSWGPTVFALVGSEAQGRELVEQTKARLNGQGRVQLVEFDNDGVQVERNRT
jgi:beta-ribofuranosylaminobenzene 5'-phosphate synthase